MIRIIVGCPGFARLPYQPDLQNVFVCPVHRLSWQPRPNRPPAQHGHHHHCFSQPWLQEEGHFLFGSHQQLHHEYRAPENRPALQSDQVQVKVKVYLKYSLSLYTKQQ